MGVTLIFLKAKYIFLLVSLSLRKRCSLSFFSTTSPPPPPPLPPPQPWTHSKSSLVLSGPLLSTPYCAQTILKVEAAVLHEMATACVFFNLSFSGCKVRKPCFCDYHQVCQMLLQKYSRKIVN